MNDCGPLRLKMIRCTSGTSFVRKARVHREPDYARFAVGLSAIESLLVRLPRWETINLKSCSRTRSNLIYASKDSMDQDTENRLPPKRFVCYCPSASPNLPHHTCLKRANRMTRTWIYHLRSPCLFPFLSLYTTVALLLPFTASNLSCRRSFDCA